MKVSSATYPLAIGAVYGLMGFWLALDQLLNSGTPVTGITGLIFIAATGLFVVNVVLLLWSLFDPPWARRYHKQV